MKYSLQIYKYRTEMNNTDFELSEYLAILQHT